MKNDTHDYPIVKTVDGQFPPQLKEVDTSVAGTVTTFEGWCPRGAKTDEAKWKIRKTVAVTASNVTTTTTSFPDGDDEFKFKWSERATLSFAY
jgi:outer membrane lipoprotein-sorting protein